MWSCEPQPEARRVCECGGASRSRRRGESVNVAGGAAARGGGGLWKWGWGAPPGGGGGCGNGGGGRRPRGAAGGPTFPARAPGRAPPPRAASRRLVSGRGNEGGTSSVLRPDDNRLTLCVSTQVGCGFECRFCLTGVMGLERNLTAAEILGQVLAANRLCDGGQRVTHIVFMGMGEPLANYAPLVQTLRILTDAKLGLGYSPRRITVSTVGLVPGIEKLGRENLKVNLAISLHAASDEVRSQLMPVNRSWSVETLVAAVRKYPLAPRQRVFFEYVMLDGINDSPEDARRLVRLLRGVRAKVNLIPFNDWDGSPFRRPPLARILAFQSILLDAEITTTVRWSKGEDIGAACGQLREPIPA